MRKLATILAVTLALLSFACGSLIEGQLPPSQEPLNLIEAGTGRPIETVVLVPVHTVATGVSTGLGHGPQWMREEELLVKPFLYRHGETIDLKRPRTFGFLFGLGGLFIGRGAVLKGVMALSRDHRALWVWALWNRSVGEPFEMRPLINPVAYRKRLVDLFESGVIRGSDLSREERDTFDLIPSRNLVVALSAAERKLVHEYLTSGS